MKTKLIVLICALTVLSLTGCNEDKSSYEYLVQHPKELTAEAQRCQSGELQDEGKCQIVMNAMTNFAAMYNDRQQEPEKFGERLLALQLELVELKKALQTAQQNLAAMQTGKASDQEIATAKLDVTKREKAYLDQRNEERMMLAVIGVNSPE